MSNTSLMPTRRTVIRTAAWTAPAVSLAVAAPAFAGSNSLPVAGTTTTSSSPDPSNKNNAVVLNTTLRSSTRLTGTVTATVQVEVFKTTGAGLASPAVSIVADPSWVGPTGSIPTFQRSGGVAALPATTAFNPTITLSGGAWNSFTATITFSSPDFPTFSVTHTYTKP